ncbi:hypothetical protein SCP_0401310 [Sparassis crispa]|uniref:DUF7770 domain-containing protein n=1 Tax=Sparassis crispa TaxID=139825 RepID=A0A401GHX7_9APHY|nr:hypothetical protein SCP_0401310 [Sparassis crispa]GBE81758.1 hypothetical protein SCP_0401310 [Sparassis crispa]
MSTVYYRDCDDEKRSSVVSTVYICGSPPSRDPGAILHWRIFLALPKRSSIRFDMTPGSDSITGLLMVTGHQYHTSQSSTRIVVVDAARSDTTADQFISVLLELQRDKYRYDGSGSGCRYWCTVALKDWERAGLLPAGSHEKLAQSFVDINKENPAQVPMPIREGIFYA